ncbi:AbiTii domain-containing protein [Tenacibaculum sp. IMCC1]|uniref:AbiTii domain-containing protein n=1 Tax=Tenacibaculum sp. Pbs-1 TaxID=3238748 RepID=A0AB33KUW7_9FLAO
METSKSEHIIGLAKEIIDDIELSRLDAQAILLKTTRLARYVNNDMIRKWLRFEMQGYRSSDEIALKYMSLTGRWTDKENNKGYWVPLSQIESIIESQKQKLSLIRIPDTSGDQALRVISSVKNAMSSSTDIISKLGGVKSRVISYLHDFATSVYYEKTFDSLAESIFDKYKEDIDLLIAENSGDVIEQIPSVINRLADGDAESISHALTTCRRIIDSFADYIYPASDETIEIGGNTLSLKKDKVQNRINAFIHSNCDSSSRKKKLRQNLSNLYERVSVGVHSDVDEKEARSLFFNTYLLLGEILSLKN